MRVCMVIAEFMPSMGRPPLYIAKRLIKDGHDVGILTSNLDTVNRKIKHKIFELEGAKTTRIWSFMGFNKVIMPGLIFRLPFLKTDVIYADGLGQFSSIYATFIGKLRGIPVVLRADLGSAPIIGKGLRALYDKYIKFASLKHSNKILVFSKKQKDVMINYGINSEKIEIVPNGVEHDKFVSKENNYLRGKLNIDTDTKIILCVCRITPGKNPELALRTLSRVKAYYEDAVLVIVGQKEDPKYYEYLINLVKELGLEEKVFFLWDVKHDDMPRIYNSSDIFFLTSKPIEGMNISSVEAMCAGLPVLTTDVSVTPEIVKEANCGYVIKDGKEAAERLLFLLTHEDIRKKFSKNGQEFASKNLTWENLTERVEKIMTNSSH